MKKLTLRLASVAILVVTAAAAFLCTTELSAQVIYDELVDGELSGDNLNPTDLLVFDVGFNTVAGTVVDARGANPNVDVFTFDILEGTTLDGIFLNSFNSTDNVAFFGIDDTDSFPFNTDQLDNNPDQNEFIGGLLFGNDVGVNLIDDIGSTFGSGFTGPLGPGQYTVYLQQLGGATVDYEFGFAVSAVPEPGSGIVLLVAATGIAMRRQRR